MALKESRSPAACNPVEKKIWGLIGMASNGILALAVLWPEWRHIGDHQPVGHDPAGVGI